MIAPLLPGAEGLPERLAGKVDRVLIDRLNYHYADWVYKKYHLEELQNEAFYASKSEELRRAFDGLGIECRVI